MTPLVSVILPTFNRLQFLAPAIDSLRAQTFGDWELIIADDGSAAPTREYLQNLHDPPRVSVLALTHSGKPGLVRNAALREARGQLVAFLDSDDLWLPHKLERQITSLRRHPHCSWGYTGFAVVDAVGQKLKSGPKARILPVISGWIAERLLNEETVIALPSVIVRRDALERLGGFDEALTMCEDDELWLRLALDGEVDGIDEPLTLIRRHREHGGDDETAWRDRQRVFEKALRTSADPRLRPILRRLRAEMAAGLARTQAASGRRLSAVSTLAASAPYSCRYRRWWRGAAQTLAQALAPRALRRATLRQRAAPRTADR